MTSKKEILDNMQILLNQMIQAFPNDIEFILVIASKDGSFSNVGGTMQKSRVRKVFREFLNKSSPIILPS